MDAGDGGNLDVDLRNRPAVREQLGFEPAELFDVGLVVDDDVYDPAEGA